VFVLRETCGQWVAITHLLNLLVFAVVPPFLTSGTRLLHCGDQPTRPHRAAT